MTKYDYGFVVGKFMPLHKGHESLINTAMSKCTKLFILSYPDTTDYGYNHLLRKTWLETRFPGAHVTVYAGTLANDPVAHQGFCASFMYHKLLEEDALSYGASVGVFSSEDYGQALAERIELHTGHPTEAVTLDRFLIKVSGTQMREKIDPKLVNRFVYNRRVAILGGESTGKSTLVRALSNLGYQTVREFGREWWLPGRQEMPDLMHIARTQVALEEHHAMGVYHDLPIICDTTPLTTAFYAKELFGYIPEELKKLADRGYDYYVLLKPSFDFVQDGTRISSEFSRKGSEFIEKELTKQGVPFLTLQEGSVSKRVAAVQNYISKCS